MKHLLIRLFSMLLFTLPQFLTGQHTTVIEFEASRFPIELEERVDKLNHYFENYENGIYKVLFTDDKANFIEVYEVEILNHLICDRIGVYQKGNVKQSDVVIWQSEGLLNNEGQKNGHWLYYHEVPGIKQVKEYGQYRNGIKEGTWSQFSIDGFLIGIETYKNGVLDGPSEKYDSLSVLEERNYKNGVLDGSFFINGNIAPDIVELDGEYKDGKRHGIWSFYDADQNTLGEYTFDSGKLAPDSELLELEIELSDTRYFNFTTPPVFGDSLPQNSAFPLLKDSLLDGKWTIYYDKAGNYPLAIYELIEYKKSGKWLFFNKNNDTTRIINYNNGVITKWVEYYYNDKQLYWKFSSDAIYKDYMPGTANAGIRLACHGRLYIYHNNKVQREYTLSIDSSRQTQVQGIKTWNKNGSRVKQEHYKNGLLHGHAYYYDSLGNNTLYKFVHYNTGNADSIITYYPNGKLRTTQYFINNSKPVLWSDTSNSMAQIPTKTWYYYSPRGKMLKTREHFIHNITTVDTNYVESRPGLFLAYEKTWYPSGALQKEAYVEPSLSFNLEDPITTPIRYISWYENGLLKEYQRSDYEVRHQLCTYFISFNRKGKITEFILKNGSGLTIKKSELEKVYKMYPDTTLNLSLLFSDKFEKKLKLKNYVNIDRGYFRLSALSTDSIFMNSFYIKTTEVTNKEYMEFINDLKQDSSSPWNASRIQKELLPDAQKMAKISVDGAYVPVYDYLTSKKYQSYPALGISWVAANEYCKWFKKHLLNSGEQQNLEHLLDIHLPTLYEWYYANYADAPDFIEVPITIQSVKKGRKNHHNIFGAPGNIPEWGLEYYCKKDSIKYLPMQAAITIPSPTFMSMHASNIVLPENSEGTLNNLEQSANSFMGFRPIIHILNNYRYPRVRINGKWIPFVFSWERKNASYMAKIEAAYLLRNLKKK